MSEEPITLREILDNMIENADGIAKHLRLMSLDTNDDDKVIELCELAEKMRAVSDDMFDTLRELVKSNLDTAEIP